MRREPILIVSRSPERRDAACSVLGEIGHPVRVAQDLAEAARVAGTFPPRCVLVDAELLAGGTTSVRDLTPGTPVRIVAMGPTSASAPAGAWDASVALPFTPAALIEAVEGTREHLASSGRERVLVVEDSPATRAFFIAVLQASGFETDEAATAEEALQRVRERRPDLILQDIVLPDSNDLDLTQSLRHEPSIHEVPIVGVSAYYPGSEGEPALPGSFDAFLVKPVDPDRLVETVRQLLPATHARAPVPGARRVLLIDDDPVQLRVGRIHLENAGFLVSVARDGLAALELALAEHPDAIVSDVLMPGIDGFDVALAVRQNEKLQKLPVILVSAHFRDAEDLALARRVGADALLLRSRDFSEVVAEVHQLLENPRERPGPLDPPSKRAREVRLIHRLERQITVNVSLAQRCATQGAQLSILGGVAEALAQSADVRTVLREVLARCLHASGLSKGAVYRVGPGGGLLFFGDAVGFTEADRPELEAAFGHLDLLERVVSEERAHVIGPSTTETSGGKETLLARAQAASAIVVPLVGAGHRLGALLLLSNVADMARKDLLGFGKAVGAYLGQAMALAAAFARLSESERKNEFLSVLAHELRGPLAPIVMATAVMKRSEKDPRALVRARDTIERQAIHLARMVDDLLDASRLAYGKLKLVREVVDAAVIFRQVVEDRRAAIEEAGLYVSLRSVEGPLWVLGDRTRLEQVLGNILSNSIKFTQPGGRIDVEVGGSEGRVLVSVTDDGIGIGPEMLKRVFEPFTQADATLDRSKGGLGLGLAVVRGLVELHGGEVTASSGGLGQGTVVHVSLPLASGAGPPVAAAPPAVATTGTRVLIIEDNPDTADLLAEFLESSGCTTEVARSGPDGVEKAGQFKPKVVLCDIGLPGMDGLAVARALRADPPTPDLKIVALSGYSEEHLDRRSDDFDTHVTKPVSPEVLLQLVERLASS